MQFAVLALAAAGAVYAQGIPAGTLLPNSSSPAGCSQNYAGRFEITIVQAAMKRDVQKRQSDSCNSAGVLVAQLSNGILTDSQGRIGGIVANRQFQFDGPPSQTGTLINGGWSTCSNGSLALGGSTVFYQCQSGGFYNLYDQSVAAQCQQVMIDIIPCSGSSAVSSSAASTAAVSSSRASSAVSSAASAASAPASSSVSVVRQTADGQVTAASATTLRSSSTTSSARTVVSQISDGQIQASSAVPRPVSQFSDGQLQATAFATTTRAATTSAAAPVSQIGDGQIQATAAATRAANTTTAAATARFTGGAANFGAEAALVGGAVAAAFALL